MIWPRHSVVDASVGIKLILDEPHSMLVRDYFGRLEDIPPAMIAVPDLFFVECANVLWKKARRGEVTPEDCQVALRWLTALHLPSTPTANLTERAITIACTHQITAYDACYVALADTLGLPLLTADHRLAAALADSRFAIVTLESLEK